MAADDAGPQFSTEFTLKLLEMVQSLQEDNYSLKQKAAIRKSAEGVYPAGGARPGTGTWSVDVNPISLGSLSYLFPVHVLCVFLYCGVF